MYDSEFFDAIEAYSQESARIIVPIVLGLVPAKRVVDVGCGRGAWLRAFQDHQVPEVLGLDGAYIPPGELLIDPASFRAVDLAGPWQLDGRYDLAVCVEVAEHLPAKSATHLVRALAAAAPIVLFSAAVPHQGGTNHINEQWPDYWESRFGALGYRRLDAIRRHVIHDDRVARWYRHNVCLYASESSIADSPSLQTEQDYTRKMSFDYVDKRALEHLMSLTWASGLLKAVPGALLRALKNRIYR